MYRRVQHRRTGAQALHVELLQAVGGNGLLYDEELLVLFGPDDFLSGIRHIYSDLKVVVVVDAAAPNTVFEAADGS